MEHVAVIGASGKPERYSYRAIEALHKKGHIPFPVAREEEEIQGFTAFKSIAEIGKTIDTVTIYVRPAVLEGLMKEIVDAAPKRVIMNPGTEDKRLKEQFEKAGIPVIEACTLVLLSTGQF